MTSTIGERPAAEETAEFHRLQAKLPGLFEILAGDFAAPRTIVVLPSLSVDADVISGISGIHHYEERMLGMLMMLRLPRTRLIYLSSQPLSETVIDYYLHFLQGVPSSHARARLTLLACHDSTPRSLSEKILDRPRLLARLREAVGACDDAYISAYTVSAHERALAVRLGLPIYGCDPALQDLGSKSGGRRLMREAGIAVADGAEDLYDEAAVATALAALKARNPSLPSAVIKLNEGLSGEGNAAFHFDGAPEGGAPEGDARQGDALLAWIRDHLPQAKLQAASMNWDGFLAKLARMGGIVEAFIEGDEKRSPSAQFNIDPFGYVEPVSTHDQVLDGHVFLGCRFPADEAYRVQIQDEAARLAQLLAQRGVLERFAVDFISVRRDDGWHHHGIEINLRKGGTTHPYLMLEFLTGGAYDPVSGLFRTRSGLPRFYYASDNLEAPHYKGLAPEDLIDIAVLNGLHYDGTTQEGVIFHLIGALSEFGKLGVVCIGATAERAEELYDRTVAVLDREQRFG